MTVERYSVVDDFGNLINPMLAEGQVHGGVAQGIGQAITEHVVYDDRGQLLTGSFMDYAMPRADNIPLVRFDTEAVPSTANAMGMKGCGEAGTVGALAAVANAVQDALWDHGVRQADMPFTPQRVWEMLNHNAIAAERNFPALAWPVQENSKARWGPGAHAAQPCYYYRWDHVCADTVWL